MGGVQGGFRGEGVSWVGRKYPSLCPLRVTFVEANLTRVQHCAPWATLSTNPTIRERRVPVGLLVSMTTNGLPNPLAYEREFAFRVSSSSALLYIYVNIPNMVYTTTLLLPFFSDSHPLYLCYPRLTPTLSTSHVTITLHKRLI